MACDYWTCYIIFFSFSSSHDLLAAAILSFILSNVSLNMLENYADICSMLFVRFVISAFFFYSVSVLLRMSSSFSSFSLAMVSSFSLILAFKFLSVTMSSSWVALYWRVMSAMISLVVLISSSSILCMSRSCFAFSFLAATASSALC